MKHLFAIASAAAACAASQAAIVNVSYTETISPVPSQNQFLAHRYLPLTLQWQNTGTSIDSTFVGWLWADGPYAPMGRGFRKVYVKFDGVEIASSTIFEPIGKPVLTNMSFMHSIPDGYFPDYYQNHTVEFGIEFFGGSSGAIQYWKYQGTFYRTP